jgi:hypothetical protein
MPTVPDARDGVQGDCHGHDGNRGFHEQDRDRQQRHIEDGEFIGIVGRTLPHWVWRWQTDADDGEGVRCPNQRRGEEE